jgi:hypothetical protein
MRKDWLALGLILVLLGLILSLYHNVSIYRETYFAKDIVVNYKPDNPLPPRTSVSAYLAKEDHFFFNFSKGRYWTNNVPGQFEPTIVEENYSIPYPKIVGFNIEGPSDTVSVEAYVAQGSQPYLISYENQSEDFTILPGGNLTFGNVGIEGIANINGTYTIKAVSLVPPSFKTEKEFYGITEDPPINMGLYTIGNAKTYPYAILLPTGILIASSGVILSVWALKTERKLRRRKARFRKS